MTAPAGAAAPPRVTVFSLGGTIASTPAPSGGVVPRLGAADLLAGLPQRPASACVEAVPFRQVPSGELTLDDVVALAGEITARFAAGDGGVVVTQGTDTIEETAFALDLLVGGTRPVVVTGAMRAPTAAGADGPANLLAAVQVAAAPEAAGMGAVVVVNDEIHAARFVRKTHTASPAAFRSHPVGPVGWVVDGRPRIAVRLPASGPGLLPRVRAGAIPPVGLVTVALGDDGRLLAEAGRLGYAGLVVEALGGGHVPARLVPALHDLATRMPVVLASRTGGGEVLRTTYGYPGSERDLLDRGLIPAGHLDAPKARILLGLALAAGADATGVREEFRARG